MTRIEPTPIAPPLHYDTGKPALLFGDDPAVVSQAAALLNAAGVRLAGQGSLDGAADRLDQQIALGLVWIEWADDATIPSDALLDRLARLAGT